MGGLFGALGQIGESQALAERQKKLDDIEKAYLQVQQQYAASNKERVGQSQQEIDLQKQREARLAKQANMPQYLGHLVAPDGSLIYGVQDPNGGFAFHKLPYSVDSAKEMQTLDAAIAQLSPDVQPIARASVAVPLAMGNFKGAQAALQPYLLGAGRAAQPQPDRVTTSEQPEWVDDPANPGKQRLVFLPRTSVSSRGGVSGGGVGSMRALPYSRQAPPTPPGVTPRGPRIIGGFTRTPASKQNTLKPEVVAGLENLKVSLYGTPGQPGLIDSLDVFDAQANPGGLRRLQMAWGLTSPEGAKGVMGRLGMIAQSEILNEKEREFFRQMNRSIGDINGLRAVSGMPRSTQALMDRYVMELPNPYTAKTKAEAMKSVGLVERQIETALSKVPELQMADPASTDDVVNQYLKSKGVK